MGTYSVRCAHTLTLRAQLVVVLPQFSSELSSLQLDLRVWRQVVPRGSLADHSVGLNVQVPVHPETQRPVQTRHVCRAELMSGYLKSLSTFTFTFN